MSCPGLSPEGISTPQEFVAALRDEIAAARTGKGESRVGVSDGRRLRQDHAKAVYPFVLDHPVAETDDAPVVLEIGTHQYPGHIIHLQGEIVASVRAT